MNPYGKTFRGITVTLRALLFLLLLFLAAVLSVGIASLLRTLFPALAAGLSSNLDLALVGSIIFGFFVPSVYRRLFRRKQYASTVVTAQASPPVALRKGDARESLEPVKLWGDELALNLDVVQQEKRTSISDIQKASWENDLYGDRPGNRKFSEALERVVSTDARRIEPLNGAGVAIHEAGHFLVTACCGVNVYEVSTISEGNIAGYNHINLKADTYEDLWNQIVIFYAGIEAERLIFGESHLGGQDDGMRALSTAISLEAAQYSPVAHQQMDALSLLREAQKQCCEMLTGKEAYILSLASVFPMNGKRGGREVLLDWKKDCAKKNLPWLWTRE